MASCHVDVRKVGRFQRVIGSRNRRRKENTKTKRKTTKEQTKHYTENWATRSPLKTEVNSGAPDG